jgi:hypothetical protein
VFVRWWVIEDSMRSRLDVGEMSSLLTIL